MTEGDIVDVDRAALAKNVFGHPEELAWLESKVHPAVARAFDTWLDSQRACTWVVREAAILFESNSDQGCDAVVTVEAPMAFRQARALRRGASSEDVARAHERPMALPTTELPGPGHHLERRCATFAAPSGTTVRHGRTLGRVARSIGLNLPMALFRL